MVQSVMASGMVQSGMASGIVQSVIASGMVQSVLPGGAACIASLRQAPQFVLSRGAVCNVRQRRPLFFPYKTIREPLLVTDDLDSRTT
jgi:hypothetical protein